MTTCTCREGRCKELEQMRADLARHDRAITQLWAALLVLAVILLVLAW